MFSQPRRTRTALYLLCGVLCATALTGIAHAQTGAAQTNVESADWDETRQTELRLKMALGTCFEAPEKIDEGTKVTIGFKLADDGRLAGVPRHLGRDGASPEQQKLYFHGLRTLHACAPFPINGPGAEFQVVFSTQAIDALYHSANAPAMQDAIPDDPDLTAQSSEADETALSLDRSARREIQLRLRLIGFDPQGVDGVFGSNTRSAISDWQTSKDLTATGYLNAAQLSDLTAQSEEQYANYTPPPARATPVRQRVRICRKTGFLGIKFCRYEYR